MGEVIILRQYHLFSLLSRWGVYIDDKKVGYVRSPNFRTHAPRQK